MKPSTRMVVLRGRKLWTPDALGLLLALWLDADDASTITLNGSTVSQWRDKSGNGRHVAQGNMANQPAYTLNSLNGRSVLLFDGLNDFLSFGAGAFQNVNTHSVFIVFRVIDPTTFGGLQHIYTLSYTNSQGSTFEAFSFYSTLSDGGFWAFGRSIDGLFTGSFVSPIPTAAAILGGELKTDRTIMASLNGNLSAAASGNANFEMHTFQSGQIGSSRTPQRFLNGEIGEIVHATTDLSTTDRQRIEGYLAHKWGLTANLPSNHPFKINPPLA